MTFNDYLVNNIFEQDWRSVSAEMAWNAAIEHCAAVIAKKSKAVIENNTVRCRISSAASYAA